MSSDYPRKQSSQRESGQNGFSRFSAGPVIPQRRRVISQQGQETERASTLKTNAGNKGPNEANQADKPIPIEALVRRNRRIIADSSVLTDGSFDAFVIRNSVLFKQQGYVTLTPQFEFESLSPTQRARIQPSIDGEILKILNVDGVRDYTSLLPAIKHMSQEKGQLCFLVNNPKKNWTIINSAKAAGIFVQLFHVSQNGDLIRGPSKSNNATTKTDGIKRGRHTDRSNTGNHNIDRFVIATTPERMRVVPIHVTSTLGKGSVVYDNTNRPITLCEQEIVNPNAVTYSTSVPGVWAKVYNPESLNTFLEEKAKRMLSKRVQYKGLCWPTDTIHDSSGSFVGMLVPPAKGEPLQLAVFKQAKLQTYFPDWDKKDLCDLAVTILRIIQYLHNMNILMGCINPAAIRVAGKDEVYFVDTDNYQVEGFPTLVYNTSFTPPELQGRKIYLCTKENENYAVAVLVFMLMMPGKIPYAIGPNQTIDQAIQDRQFPFPYGNVHGGHAMPSMWRFMWSHLTPFKDPFFNTFQKGGKYESPEHRRTVGNWIGTVLRFRDELEHPYDPESLKIYPRTFKRGKNVEFYTCRYCGTAHPKFYFNNRYFDTYRICNSCIDQRSDVSFTCRACGKTYYYTNRTALFHAMKKMTDSGWKDQKYCRDCKGKTMRCIDCGDEQPYYYLRNGRCHACNERHQNTVYKSVVCRDCRRSFSITNGEHEYFLQKGWSDPVRCKSCRSKKTR